MSQFILLEQLIIKHKDKVLCDIQFTSDTFEHSGIPITTSIIGTNGVGKSFVLMEISEIFNALGSSRNVLSLKYDYYQLSYNYDNHFCKIKIANKKVHFVINEQEVSYDKMIFPTKVLGVSYILNDKFKFKLSDDEIYQYCGVRQTSNASWTSSISNKVADYMMEIFATMPVETISNITNFLEIDNMLSFLITPKSKTFFKRKKNITELQNRAAKYKNDYRIDKIKKLDFDSFQNIIDFLEEIKSNHLFDEDKDGRTTFEFTFSGKSDSLTKSKLNSYYRAIKNLNTLGYIKNISLCFYKNKDIFPFEFASSGEKHFIFEMVSILANIKSHSIILIDEPEISMHPNWQLKYISGLKNIFKNFSSCHFIISTHSHFIVSNLDSSSSSLVAMEYDSATKTREATLIPYSTYAWSAENILYNIFKVRTTRNWFFEQDVAKLIFYIDSKEPDKESINQLIAKLDAYKLSDNDPLIELISEAKKYVELL
ncbi:putative ATP-binding protein involved in virulence [Hydrogenoanaerobacterium saccharovorans]|uniref:Predicted ATP-binding protein involved in virulence n=1 Tax=Hydrogenoanaerobacterium saccharovorans TaxID=474960 RepID=A0A1H8AY66_9FIRM|nr:AAA family ATPase [Hydrogenoanaerobacterium saccharovorans]RPF47682.1 putative ATP-binding protein involved in virulence [Hydrogenoanaerobacterium saccharovorans]SEM75692.1 Predicted ATP-binding protein involved in virulence [Hydrogenoanaerobacterium saccharovorans]